MSADVVNHALAGHDSSVSGAFDARPQRWKEVRQMKRAVIRKRYAATMIVTALALAAGSVAGVSHSTPAASHITPMTWCPPAC